MLCLSQLETTSTGVVSENITNGHLQDPTLVLDLTGASQGSSVRAGVAGRSVALFLLLCARRCVTRAHTPFVRPACRFLGLPAEPGSSRAEAKPKPGSERNSGWPDHRR